MKDALLHDPVNKSDGRLMVSLPGTCTPRRSHWEGVARKLSWKVRGGALRCGRSGGCLTFISQLESAAPPPQELLSTLNLVEIDQDVAL